MTGVNSEVINNVHPDGTSIRRRRRAFGWSRRELVSAISRATQQSEGISQTLSPSLLAAVEEKDEAIPYTTLCLIANGLECNPSMIIAKIK